MQLKEFEQEKKLEYANLKDDEHVLQMWTPFSIQIDENYKFVSHNIFFKIISSLLYIVVYAILVVFDKVMFGFHVKGLSNLWAVDGGKITVSNHIHPMDCTMNAIINGPNKLYFPTLQSNFEIPLIRWLIKLLNAIPIPEKMEAKKAFYHAIDGLLQDRKTVHFYPEAAMRPYCNKIRNFKRGAFHFSVQNNVPIVPIVYTYSEVTGIRKVFKEKPFINANILPAMYPDCNLPEAEAVEKLRSQVQETMTIELERQQDITEKAKKQ